MEHLPPVGTILVLTSYLPQGATKRWQRVTYDAGWRNYEPRFAKIVSHRNPKTGPYAVAKELPAKLARVSDLVEHTWTVYYHDGDYMTSTGREQYRMMVPDEDAAPLGTINIRSDGRSLYSGRRFSVAEGKWQAWSGKPIRGGIHKRYGVENAERYVAKKKIHAVKALETLPPTIAAKILKAAAINELQQRHTL